MCGFARSFGLLVGDERREWVKPIMFSGGVGSIDDRHIKKEAPHPGELNTCLIRQVTVEVETCLAI